MKKFILALVISFGLAGCFEDDSEKFLGEWKSTSNVDVITITNKEGFLKVIYKEPYHNEKIYLPELEGEALVFPSGAKFLISKEGVLTSNLLSQGEFVKK